MRSTRRSQRTTRIAAVPALLAITIVLLAGCAISGQQKSTPLAASGSSPLPVADRLWQAPSKPPAEVDDPNDTAPDNGDTESIAILWGKFRTNLSMPDPELDDALEESPLPGTTTTAPSPPADRTAGPPPTSVPAEASTAEPAPVTAAMTAPASSEDTPAEPTTVTVIAPPANDTALDPATIAPRPATTTPRERDLWDRIRSGFAMSGQVHERVRREAEWYSRHQDYLDRTVERARPYLYLIVSALDGRNMPMEIALLPIVESAYQPFAYSHGRAAGLWQFIPGTARRFGLIQNWWYDGRRDVMASTTAALDYLEQLRQTFKGDWELALAAYNSGAGTVRKAIRWNKRRGRPTDFWHLRLPRETRAYVPKLLALRSLVATPERYGIRLASIPDRPQLAVAHLDSQIDLAMAADLAGIGLEEIYRLNPGFNRWATAPDGPHRLLLPVDRLARFEAGLRELPPDKRIHWQRHRIRRGETLGHIARRYRTTVRVLAKVNKIHGHLIRTGDNLIIPVATRDIRRYTLSAEQRLKRLTAQPPAKQRRKASHRVHRGDTFWDLARRYNTTVRELARWNGMSPRDLLRPGQRLVVWLPKVKDRSASTGTFSLASPSTSHTTRRIQYVVKKGDSLARISQRFKVRISELRHWNDLPRGRYIQPGQRLTLYVDVTRQTENI